MKALYGVYDHYPFLGYSLREAEGDPNTTSPEEDTDTTSAEDIGDPNSGGEDETEATAGEEDTGDSTDESPDDTNGDDNADENFDIDAEDDTGDEESSDENSEDDMGDTDTESSDPNSDDSSESEEEEIDPDSLKALDGKLYSDLSPAEQKLKVKELKNLYIELYYSCTNVAEKLNSIYVDEDQDANLQVKMVAAMVSCLKRMISDYFRNTFNSKSYEENDMMFNRYLDLMNQVKMFIKDLKKSFFSDSE